MMHIIVTVIVVFTTIFSFYFIAFGYLRQENLRPLGAICLTAAVLITVFGVFNPIGMAMQLNILGLTERLVIFTLQVFVFFLSFIYTFDHKLLSARE
jgi:glucose-6-phosphate-specific signal transduction histidine kinase